MCPDGCPREEDYRSLERINRFLLGKLNEKDEQLRELRSALVAAVAERERAQETVNGEAAR